MIRRIEEGIAEASQQIDQIDAYQAQRARWSVWRRLLTWPLAVYLRRQRRQLGDRLFHMQRRRGVL